MNKMIWVVLGLLLSGLTSSPASAQEGCLWCVTPSTCDWVDESAAAGCSMQVGGACGIVGLCAFVPGGDEEELETSAQMMWSEMAAAGLEMIELETPSFGSLPFVEIGDGVLGAFNCGGSLFLVASTNDDGSMTFGPAESSLSSVTLSNLWIETVGFTSTLGLL